MKSSVKILTMVLCFTLMTACTVELETDSTNSTSTNTTSANATSNTKQETAEKEIAEKSNLSEEQQQLVASLEAALAFTKQQDMVYFSHYNNVETYNNDGSSSSYYYNDYADMQRQPAIVSLNGSRGSVDYVKNGDNFETENEFSTSYQYYYSKEHGQFYNYEGEENWHRDTLTDDFKTVEHIEDLISFFLQFPDQLSLTIEPLEGGFEELDQNETVEFRRVNLDFSMNQFVEHTVFLTKNFFTGNHDPIYASSPYDIVSPDLNNYSVSLLLDDQNRVNELYVSYETQDYDKTEYTQYYTLSVSFFYDKDMLPVEITIPDEVLNNADDASRSRG